MARPKKVGHLVECEASSSTTTMILGVRQQAGGATAEKYAQTIKETVDELPPGRMKENISNVMSDRCVTKDAVERALEGIGRKNVQQVQVRHPPPGQYHHGVGKMARSIIRLGGQLLPHRRQDRGRYNSRRL